ncbi:MAG: bifunctional isocitrate dehydrogenase kinase/phosphatase [Candidatus Latescibacterota bacterium]|nr:MAG: bifunctional isocitrate dehydrogenase kinase/phosphatase [Candidatus Latescibacterota bacterium]
MRWQKRELPLHELGAKILYDAFLDYIAHFRRLTLQARSRFEQRDWPAGRRDAVARLGVYRSAVREGLHALEGTMGVALRDRNTWRRIKREYAQRIAARGDVEIAETFFNSATRRIFTTIGVDREIEFLAHDDTAVNERARGTVVEVFIRRTDVRDLAREILHRYRFSVGYEDLERDARLLAGEIESYTPRIGVRSIELVRPVFYRNKGAYIIGRIRGYEGTLPLVIALLNVHGQARVDAVLLAEHEVSVVFSFTRSYFLVAAERPRVLVRFLQSIMRHKPLDELYNSIGYNRHGKSELYRALLQQLERSDDRFEIALGARGMVMIVFTMRSFDVVFKVIRDHFAPPKNTTRRQVMQKYQLVFQHDRAGRLVDAQEFEYFKFARERFAPELLDELRTHAAQSVDVDATHVVIRHLYTERRLVPLDLYLREADPEQARAAVLDYGQALRDLAATNIFPGDLLPKNFGVTRNRRLVFYDYDELCLLTDCRFRRLPQPSTDEEEMAGEAWFYTDDRDIFPEEFAQFLEFRGPLRQAFLEAHSELLDVRFWRRRQQAQRTTAMADLYPYPPERRLHARGADEG